MVKFFRGIRKNLLDNGKNSKYFKYAIGEIVLVVIGILIALQINTWNQQRLIKIDETKTLKSLFAEFSENLIKFDAIYKDQKTRDSIVKRLLKPSTINEPFETLDSLIYKLGWNFKFNPSMGIYTSVINSSKIEIISNDSLKNRISNFNNILVDYEEEEIGANYYGTNFLTPYLRSQLYYRYPFKNRTESQYLYDSINYPKVIKSDRTRNEFLFYWSYMLITLEKGQALREEIKDIIDMIYNELQSKRQTNNNQLNKIDMGIFWDLLQQDELDKQKSKAATLEDRVTQLELELSNTKVLLKKTLVALETHLVKDIDGDGVTG